MNLSTHSPSGDGQLCIHCRAPACNQECLEEVMMTRECKSTEAVCPRHHHHGFF